tara:strand:+ start:3216 stop:3398 length:183 start_codon:yes stop_codon:yes gene_type:complete
MNINELWIGKTGNTNAWYHIYPFTISKYINEVNILRHGYTQRKSRKKESNPPNYYHDRRK